MIGQLGSVRRKASFKREVEKLNGGLVSVAREKLPWMLVSVDLSVQNEDEKSQE